MRVIAGRLRSRKLVAPPGDLTRPTHDRVKEALFSMLGNIAQRRVLDLYAGTGALGIEALSRGAGQACFVERSTVALGCIRRNLEELKLTATSTVIARTVESSVPDLSRLGPYDLVFCDPPWADMAEVIALLCRMSPSRWMSPEGLLILEHPTKFTPPSAGITGLVEGQRRSWGDTAVTFYHAPSSELTDDETGRS